MLAGAIIKLGMQTLTSAHQATVKQMAARLHTVSIATNTTIYGELNNDLHMPHYADIPDESWEQIVIWFRQ